ncbi:MAG: hypothetical protein ACFFDN_08725 [Candidatus Hodarchaeota archaeon]
MRTKKFKQTIERKIILQLFDTKNDELDYLLLLFRKFKRLYKRDIVKDVMDIIQGHDDIREDFPQSVFNYILYEILVEINKKYDIYPEFADLNYGNLDLNYPTLSFESIIHYLDDYSLTKKKKKRDQVIEEFHYWEQLRS